ncbi:hypothetical protein R1sor_019884 [Riccia sorocarpa]|uniref:RING-type domain-containing protein n=1 Tax=Riccia sorocarpa TaxID=122646 RepID=A0ABD3II56_9MARC
MSMDVTMKTEDGHGESIKEVGNASVRDGDVGSGSLKDRGKKNVSSSDGETKTETKTDWNEEDFVLMIDYFAIDCNLPNDGQLPGDVPKSLVSDEEFERCFGLSTGFKGRNGPNIKNCVGLPQSEVLHLFQVIDGHDKPVNGTMGKMFPRALYAERFLKNCGEPAISKKPVILKEVKPKVEPAATVSGEQEEAPSVKHATKVEAPKSGVKSEARPTTYMPGVLELKANIRNREKLIAKLQDDITAQSDAIDSIRDKLKIVAESISNAESQFKTDNAECAKLETERSTLAARKQTLEMRLEDGGFNENDPEPEDMKLLSSLESEEEDLNLSYFRVLTAIEECTSKLVQTQTELKLCRSKEGGLNAKITVAEFEIQKLQSSLTKAESIVEAQIGELKHVEPFAEASIATLSPMFISTATEVTKAIFRLSSCLVCCLGFHCMNFMPTPCGHVYHPACLAALVAHSGLQCLECSESFHPHWCESWGFDTTEKHRREWEEKTGLQKQQDAFSDCIKSLYQKTPNLLSERRTIESEKRQCLNVKYIAAGVERTWRVSTAATKVRGASPCSTILSSREDDRDNDTSLVATNHVPVTRSKKGKQGGSKADVPARKMAGDSQSRFLGILQITKCWGPSEGQLTYAGCGRILKDGRPCGLGLRGRKTREIDGWSQSGVLECTPSSQMSTPAGKSRDRAGHTCAESSVHMFHFFVETGEPSNHVLEVWDRACKELFKMTGQEFFDKYGSDVESLRKFVSGYLASTHWAVTVIGNSSAGAFLRVLSFSRAEVSLPKKESMLVSAPSPRVEVVHIPAVPDRAESAVQISSNHG